MQPRGKVLPVRDDSTRFPRVLSAAGVHTSHVMGFPGIGRPLLVGESRELSRPIAAESGRRMQALYLKDGKKVILDVPRHSVEVYDLNLDPGEQRNLTDSGGADVHAAIETTRLFFDVQRLKLPGWSPPYRRFQTNEREQFS